MDPMPPLRRDITVHSVHPASQTPIFVLVRAAIACVGQTIGDEVGVRWEHDGVDGKVVLNFQPHVARTAIRRVHDAVRDCIEACGWEVQ